jgi:glucose-1-phosphate adenylyltransferase
VHTPRERVLGCKVLGLVMAGGKGERLFPLTRDRAKPAVPFGGKYRIIDFVLSNFVNSGIRALYVLTQFKSQSLTEHIRHTWRFGSVLRDQFVSAVPAQMKRGESWYKGTADAVRQNIDLVLHSDADIVAVFGADHIYRMDVSRMVEYHLEKGADITVASVPVPKSEARSFGIVRVDENWRVKGFQEKPARPATIPGDPERVLASMGNYLFSTPVLIDILEGNGERMEWNDFGRDILPKVFRKRRLYAYDFNRNIIPGMLEGEENSYWRDVGTIEAYYAANMELRHVSPPLNLYNDQWPIITSEKPAPPVKFVFNDADRRGCSVDSIIASGTIISGGMVQGSILGWNVRVNSFSKVHDSILMEGVEIGRGCRVRRAIIDKNVSLPPETSVGYDPEEDRKRFFVSPSGIVVIPRSPRLLSLGEMRR